MKRVRPLFDCLGCERSKLDVVHLCAPVCALAAAVEPVDIARDLAQGGAVAFECLGMDLALFMHCVQVFADRHVRFFGRG
jgi:hypothetical protein